MIYYSIRVGHYEERIIFCIFVEIVNQRVMKTAIIIGATSGIGRALAVRMAKDGWKLGVAGRRVERLEELAAQFPEGTIITQALDVTKPEATEALDALLGKTGAPDLFVHVSGVGHQNRELEESIEIKTMDTNCTGMVRIVTHFVNYVKSSGAYSAKHKAHIGVVTSVSAVKGMGTAASYSSSKMMQATYITALSQLARMEKIPVRFSDIRPGFVDTDLLDKSKKYPMMLTVEQSANYIVKGLKKKRRMIIFNWPFKLLTFFWGLLPRAWWERMTFVSN